MQRLVRIDITGDPEESWTIICINIFTISEMTTRRVRLKQITSIQYK